MAIIFNGEPGTRWVNDTGVARHQFFRNWFNSYKATQVSHLIVEAFHGPRPPEMEVRHFPDREPTNNRASNLRYGTRQENEDDKKIHGARPKGSRNANAKIHESDVAETRIAFARGESKSSIARRYGLHHSTVGDILNGRTWRRTPREDTCPTSSGMGTLARDG